jgi:hypothetical protein
LLLFKGSCRSPDSGNVTGTVLCYASWCNRSCTKGQLLRPAEFPHESFKEFPPRSIPPSFNPANMMEGTLRDIKAKQKLERAFPLLRGETAK